MSSGNELGRTPDTAPRAGRLAVFLLLSVWLASAIAGDIGDRSLWLLLDGLLLLLWLEGAWWALQPAGPRPVGQPLAAAVRKQLGPDARAAVVVVNVYATPKGEAAAVAKLMDEALARDRVKGPW